MVLLDVKNLRAYYYTLRGVVKAVDGVNFRLPEKTALGLAGESACGKTTKALSLMRILPPMGRIVGGEVILDGQDIVKISEQDMRKIRWKKIALVFQSAMNALNPVFKIKDQIIEAIMIHESEITKDEALGRAKDLITMVRMDSSYLERYPHELSGGMKQRAIIAMALANYPNFLILDEPTTALDFIVQAQILKLIKSLQKRLNLSLLFISHDLSVLSEVCDDLAIMYAGKIVEYSNAQSLITQPKHPYAQGMIESFPSLSHPRRHRFTFIPGIPPDLINPPQGCRFHPRCIYTKDVCRHVEPEMIEVEKGHQVTCHLYT